MLHTRQTLLANLLAVHGQSFVAVWCFRVTKCAVRAHDPQQPAALCQPFSASAPAGLSRTAILFCDADRVLRVGQFRARMCHAICRVCRRRRGHSSAASPASRRHRCLAGQSGHRVRRALHYPIDASTIGWSFVIGAAALPATLAATFVLRVLPRDRTPHSGHSNRLCLRRL